MKLWMKVLIAVVLTIVLLCVIFKPVIADYIRELLKTIEFSEYSPIMDPYAR